MSDPRPPYVQFEMRAVENRTASIETGHYVARDVVFALVTPAGSRDRVEKVAEEWIRDMEEGARQDRIPIQWPQIYRQALKLWLENRQDPEFGTPVKDWPAISPAQVRILQDVGITSIEQVAEMNDEAISKVGMGGRALKSKAQAWLDAAKSTGATAGELDSLRIENAALEGRATEAEAKLKDLETRFAVMEKSLEKAK